MHRHFFKSLTRALLAVLLIACLPHIAHAQETPLQAGVAEVNITPPAGMRFGRSGQSEGEHDSLYARVLILSTGKKKAALINLDLGGNPDRDMQEEIRKSANSAAGVTSIVFTAIHTHAAPFGMGGDEKAQAWRETVPERIIEGIIRANDDLAEARIGVGFGQAYLNHNRLHVKTDGGVRWLGNGPVNFVTFPVDPSVGVIRIDDREGTPRAILVNYACHPVVVFSEDNTKYSADFPGAMKKWVQGHLPGGPVCFYIIGAAGDINPIVNPTPIIENSLQLKDELGEALGREVVRVASGLQTHMVPNARLQTRVKEIGLTMRWDKDKVLEAARRQYGEQIAAMIEQRYSRDVKAPLTFLMLHDEFAICGFPGEFYVEFQLDLRRRFTSLPLFFAGITGESLGYFPTIRAAVQGGYGSNTTSTSVEVGAGEKLVTEAVVELNYMTGQLSHELP